MRITEKNGNFYKLKKGNEIYGEENGIRLVQIVGKFEDIEEKYGIDIELYFKIIHEGVYVKGKEPEWGGVGSAKDIEHYNVIEFDKEFLELVYNCSSKTHIIWDPMKSYGKIWASTKEELE